MALAPASVGGASGCTSDPGMSAGAAAEALTDVPTTRFRHAAKLAGALPVHLPSCVLLLMVAFVPLVRLKTQRLPW